HPPPAVRGGPAATPADGPVDEELVRLWLAQAFVTAGADVGRPVSGAAARAEADRVCASPDRVSLMARHEGRTVGHATFLTDRDDETTGETVVELVDILTDGAPAPTLVTAELTRAALAHAHALGRPLIGSVVHTPAPDGGGLRRTVPDLPVHGWRVDHVYWWAPAPRPTSS
ncbi:hypothetical protein ACVNF4_33860, partial [Streptomyces sp. S6]